MMRSLISDIQNYLKQNYKKNGTIYSACAEQFIGVEKVEKKKSIVRAAPPKITKKIAPQTTKEATRPPQAKTKEVSKAPGDKNVKKEPLVLQKATQKNRAPPGDFRSFYGNFAPNFHIHDKPKADDLAKKVKAKSLDQKVLSDVVIFTDSSMNTYNRLLGNIAHAIEIKLCPCRLLDISPIEQGNRWENIFSSHKLQLIMIPRSVLENKTNLLTYFKDDLIGGVETFFFEDLDQVQKVPEKKKALWNSITKAIKI